MKYSFFSNSLKSSLFSLFAKSSSARFSNANGPFSFLALLSNTMIKPLAKKITLLVTKNATGSAQQYATSFASELSEKIPGAIDKLANVVLPLALSGQNPVSGIHAAATVTDALTNKQSSLNFIFKLPFKGYKAYKTYKHLNKDNGFTTPKYR